VYELISNVVISIGILCIVLALVLAFVFKVGTLFNEVSGRRARKQIKELKEMGVASGFLKQSSGLMDFEGFETVGDLSASMVSEANIEERVLESDEEFKSAVGEAIPEVIETAKKISTSGFEELITSEKVYNEDATQLLDDLESEATTMLESAEEEVDGVSDEDESTEFLEEAEEGTNLLVEAEEEATGMLIDEDEGVVLEVLEVLTSVN
jgi:hypothetical protein